jgi:hypothetical protein
MINQERLKGKVIGRFSRRDALPLLRGMFVYPESLKRLSKLTRADVFNFVADDAKAVSEV